MRSADRPAEMGRVTTHAKIMFLKSVQSTPPLLDRSHPTNTTDPTLQWVVLTGIPIFEATSTVIAEPISIVKPLNRLKMEKIIRIFI
jgi:multisubunit Na+/H+ antiporter MnhC subunit